MDDKRGDVARAEADISLIPVFDTFITSEALTADCSANQSLVSKGTSAETESLPVVPSRDSGQVNEHARCWSCVGRLDDGDAWLAAAMVLIITFTIATEFSTFGIYYVEYTRHYDASKASIGWIKGIQTMAGGSFGVFGGTFVEVYGCRRVAFLGTLCAFIGMMTASMSTDIYMLYVTQGIVLGVGLNTMNISGAVSVQRHFTKNPVLGSGLAFMGFTIGSMVSPLLISALLDAFSLRGALLIHSAIIAQAMPASLLLRRPPAPAPPRIRTEERRDPAGADLSLSRRLRQEICDFALFRDVRFCLMAIAGLMCHYTISTFVSHLPGRAVHYGLSRARAAYLQPIVSTASLGSRIVCTLFANLRRVNKQTFYCVFVWFVAAAPICYAFVTDLPELVIPPIVFGLGMGGSTTVILVVLVCLFGLDQLPKALSLYTIATSTGLALGPPISGIIFDWTQNYDIPFLLAGCVCVCANVLFITVMFLHHHQSSANQKHHLSPEPRL